jgi:1,4-alpha-glucan branching enzyme
LALVLHAHLPFVRQPRHRVFLEERWLYEALTGSYLPLLAVFRGLRSDGIPFRATVSLSPTLLAMLGDPLLRSRFASYLRGVEGLARAESVRREEPEVRGLAAGYASRLAELRGLWEMLGGDVAAGYADLAATGHLELMTCAATHGYLPLLSGQPEAVRAQLAVGVSEYRRWFGVSPRGIWLPECGYEPGLEEGLAAEGLRFFVLDTHALEEGSPAPRWGVYAPVYCPNGVAVFGRDPESSRQVWSADSGYPGDVWYREFYRDAGFDLPVDALGDAGHPDGLRMATGLKYHRITARGSDVKAWYDPERARERVAAHAEHFVSSRLAQADRLSRVMSRPPVMVAPYDAELFGHWWYEGPAFLDAVFRRIAAGGGALRSVTPAEYLREHPVNQRVRPAASSWGSGGYNAPWLESSNAWVYRHLHRAAADLAARIRTLEKATGPVARALDQAVRELLLAQASDWAFILMARTSERFAEERIKTHLGRLRRLWWETGAGRIDEAWLAEVEAEDNLFPSVDHRVYR